MLGDSREPARFLIMLYGFGRSQDDDWTIEQLVSQQTHQS